MTWQQVRSSPCFPRILLDLFLIIQANVWEDQSEDSDTLISTSSGSTVYVEESEEYSNLKLDGRDRVEQADQKNPENAIENPDLRSKAVRSNEKVDGSSVETIISQRFACRQVRKALSKNQMAGAFLVCSIWRFSLPITVDRIRHLVLWSCKT